MDRDQYQHALARRRATRPTPTVRYRPGPAAWVPPMPEQDKVRLLGESVHQAICEGTRTDGYGRCSLYAMLGAKLALTIIGRPYWPVAGSLYLRHDAADPTYAFTMLATDGGFRRGEYQAWVVQQPALIGSTYQPDEILDHASRHYRRYVEQSNYLGSVEVAADGRTNPCQTLARQPWSIEEPPPFVWARGGVGMPPWLSLVPDPEATRDMYHELGGMPADVRALAKRAAQVYLQLANQEANRG